MTRLLRTCLLASTLAALLAWPVAAQDIPASKTSTTTWTVTLDGKTVATETLKIVLSGTGNHFSTMHIKPKGKGKVGIIAVLQRDPDGKLRKYRRVRDERKGAGVMIFRRGESLRFVPINEKRPALDLPAAARRLVWDADAPGALWEWASLLAGAGETETRALKAFDVSSWELVEATAHRGSRHVLAGPKGREVDAQKWEIGGLGAEITLYLSPDGDLVGIEFGKQKRLQNGWSWEPPVAAPGSDAGPDAGPTAQPATDAAPASGAGDAAP